MSARSSRPFRLASVPAALWRASSLPRPPSRSRDDAGQHQLRGPRRTAAATRRRSRPTAASSPSTSRHQPRRRRHERLERRLRARPPGRHHDAGQRQFRGGPGEQRQLLPVHLGRRPLRRLRVRRHQPRRRRHERQHGRLRARPPGGHHQAGQHQLRGAPGERRQLLAVHLGRRPLRRLRLGRQQPRRRRHERQHGRLRARPPGGHHQAGLHQLRGAPGERQQLLAVDLGRRPLRRLPVRRHQPRRQRHERRLRRLRARPAGGHHEAGLHQLRGDPGERRQLLAVDLG